MNRNLSINDATVLALTGMLKENKTLKTESVDEEFVDMAYDLIVDYLYNDTDRDEVSFEEIQDYIYNDICDDELTDYTPSDETIDAIQKKLNDNGYKVLLTESKQLNEERYYYGEVNYIKDELTNVSDNLKTRIGGINKLINDREEYEYSDLQIATLEATSDNLTNANKFITSSIEALDKNFPSRIRKATPEEIDYIKQHKDDIPFAESKNIKVENKKLTEGLHIDYDYGVPFKITIYYDNKILNTIVCDTNKEFNDVKKVLASANEVELLDWVKGVCDFNIKGFNNDKYRNLSKETESKKVETASEDLRTYLEDEVFNYITAFPTKLYLFTNIDNEDKAKIKAKDFIKTLTMDELKDILRRSYLGVFNIEKWVEEHKNKTTKTENKKLTENEMTDLKDQLSDNREPNKEELEKETTGVIDGILVIVDPEINTEDYEEVIERANEIIEDTEEGKIPYIEDYLGQFIQTCPICGKTFVSKQLLQGGDTCPLCLEQPEQFITVGKIEPDEEQEEGMKGQGDLDTDLGVEQVNTMEELEDLDEEMPEEETL